MFEFIVLDVVSASPDAIPAGDSPYVSQEYRPLGWTSESSRGRLPSAVSRSRLGHPRKEDPSGDTPTGLPYRNRGGTEGIQTPGLLTGWDRGAGVARNTGGLQLFRG